MSGEQAALGHVLLLLNVALVTGESRLKIIHSYAVF